MPASAAPFAQKVYRLLLRAYPAPFRRGYGALMLQHFNDCYRRARLDRDPASLPCFWIASLSDLAHTAFLERLAQIRLTRWWLGPLAIVLGLGIGYVDYTATEVQATLLVLLPVAFCFGAAAPRSAWRWALVLGLAIPLVHIIGHAFNIRPPYHDMVIQSLLALIPSFLAAYSGAGLRWLGGAAALIFLLRRS